MTLRGALRWLSATSALLILFFCLSCSSPPPPDDTIAVAPVADQVSKTPIEPVSPSPEIPTRPLSAGTMHDVELADDALTRELLQTGINQVTIHTPEFVFDALAAGPENGNPVILLHGFPSTSYQWRSQLKVLGEAGYRALAPNQRGYSPLARPLDVNAYTYDLLVEDVFVIADTLGWEKFHLVGHDWGAFVAWAAAGLNPDRILSLTPISVPHPEAFAEALADPTGEQAQMSSYMEFFRSEGSENAFLDNGAELLKSIYISADLSEKEMEPYLEVLGTPEALGAALNWYRANNFLGENSDPTTGRRTHIPDILVPTMFVWSDEDTALGRQGAELTGSFVSGTYRFEVLEGVNHWVTEVAAEQVSRLLLEHFGNS